MQSVVRVPVYIQAICREVAEATGVATEDVATVLADLGMTAIPDEVTGHWSADVPGAAPVSLADLRVATRGRFASQMLVQNQEICRELAQSTGFAADEVGKVLAALGLTVTPDEVTGHWMVQLPGAASLSLDDLRGAMRGIVVALLLTGVAATAPSALASDSGSTIIVNGGTSRNETNLDLSADGGTAVANANGGDDNVAVGVLGSAEAGNGGDAAADASGGMIELGDVNSGNNTGNVVNVRGSGGGNTIASGGTSRNETTINLSADGGTADAERQRRRRQRRGRGPRRRRGRQRRRRRRRRQRRHDRDRRRQLRRQHRQRRRRPVAPTAPGLRRQHRSSTAAPAATRRTSTSAPTAARPTPTPTAATTTSRSGSSATPRPATAARPTPTPTAARSTIGDVNSGGNVGNVVTVGSSGSAIRRRQHA